MDDYELFKQVLTAIGNFCICSIALGMVIEIIVMYPIQHRAYREGIDNLLVLLIGGIPIAMPTVLSVTMAIGSHRLSEQGAITKRMTAIEEMAGMDVLCSDKTGTLTLNKLTVDKYLIEVKSLANCMQNNHLQMRTMANLTTVFSTYDVCIHKFRSSQRTQIRILLSCLPLEHLGLKIKMPLMLQLLGCLVTPKRLKRIFFSKNILFYLLLSQKFIAI